MPDTVCVVGHPFALIGMGEVFRAIFRALNRVGVELEIRDVYGLNDPDQVDPTHEMQDHLVKKVRAPIRIFVLNGDEREQAMAHMANDLQGSAYNIVYPLWELETYPKEWAELVDQYDEVWAASQHVYAGYAAALKKPVYRLPLAVQPATAQCYSRRHFGISDTAYVFVYNFDMTSYIHRKNPHAVVEAYQKLRERHPFEETLLVLRVNNRHAHQADLQPFLEQLDALGDRVLLIDRHLSHDEFKNLVRCSDCYLSLHRAEGFGFGPAEAMFYGKPVISTGYSGNMEYMNKDVACLVDFKMIPVGAGQYPFAEGQVWADPDVDQAVHYMERLLKEPAFGRDLGRRANAHLRTHFSRRAIGLRYLERLEAIADDGSKGRRSA